MDNEAPAPLPDEIFLAGFWVRGGALLIDTVILMLCVFLPVQGLPVLVAIAYRTIFITQGGQTPGKMAAGIQVLTATGEPVGIGRALARAVAEYLSGLLFCLGYLVAAFSDKRALHDYVAGTRVIYVPGVGQGRKTAFSILGVLALVLPVAATVLMITTGTGSLGKFKTLSVKTGEGATKAHLGSMRAALSLYYGDAEGHYPATLDALVDPKYLSAVPATKLANHKENTVWTAYGAEVCTGKTGIDAGKIKDTGGWGYVADPKAPCSGIVFVDCTHKDTKGKLWPDY